MGVFVKIASEYAVDLLSKFICPIIKMSTDGRILIKKTHVNSMTSVRIIPTTQLDNPIIPTTDYPT